MQSLVHAYVDGELDLMTNLRIEQHLAGCTGCSEVYKSQRALHSALGGGSLYYQAPVALEERIRASIGKAGKAEGTLYGAPRLPWRLFAFAAAVAAVIIAAVGILALVRPVPGTPGHEGLAQEVVASHIRSLMGNHLEDVASTDQHTVKPWFDGKLDFSPTVNDFSAQGFPLVGGRLDYLANRPVAALVYGRHKHFINLFIWPQAGGADTGVQTTDLQGYQAFHWTKAGMTYWAVSDVNAADLGQFVQLMQGGAEPTPVP
jgi:anti-sigma factor RsiW